MKNQRKNRKGNFREQNSLFSATIKAMPIPPDYTDSQKIKDEIELFGFPLSVHPLELFASSFDARQCVSACEMNQYVGRKIMMVGWLITEKSAQTKHGDPMEFATFEDLTGLYDATFFPETYRCFGHLLSGGKPYMMEGLVEEEFRTLTLTVNKIWVPSPSPCFDSSIPAEQVKSGKRPNLLLIRSGSSD